MRDEVSGSVQLAQVAFVANSKNVVTVQILDVNIIVADWRGTRDAHCEEDGEDRPADPYVAIASAQVPKPLC